MMGTNYFMNTKDKPSHTNVFYKDPEGNLNVIRADTLDALEARSTVIDVLSEMSIRKNGYAEPITPVLALIVGGKG